MTGLTTGLVLWQRRGALTGGVWLAFSLALPLVILIAVVCVMKRRGGRK